jgi:hypothetical protein
MIKSTVTSLIFIFTSAVCYAQDVEITPDMYEFSKNSITGVYVCTPRHVESGDCSDVDDEYYRNLAIITLGAYEIGLLEVNNMKTIAFKGPLSPGSAKNLINILERYADSVDTLVLSSQGGSLEEAHLIADYVAEKNLNTWVPARRMCLSACTTVFLNGNTQTLDGLLGFHSGSYNLQDPYQIRDVEAANETIAKALYQNDFYLLKQVRLFLDLEISLDLIEAMTEARGTFLIFDDLDELYSFDSNLDHTMTEKDMVERSKNLPAVNFDFQGYVQLF